MAVPPESAMESLADDLRLALRALRRGPSVTLLAAGSLAVALAGNTAVFSFLNVLAYRPLPFPEPERLILLGQSPRDRPRDQQLPAISVPNFFDLRERQSSFEDVVAFSRRPLQLEIPGGGSRPLSAAAVTPGFFEILRASAHRGRFFAGGEARPGNDRVTVLSHRFWREHLGGRDLLGETVTLSGEAYEIVGITAEAFDFLWTGAELYVPLALDRAGLESGAYPRHQRDVLALGRLRPGVSDAAAKAELAALMAELTAAHPEANRGFVLDPINLRTDFPDPRNVLYFQLVQGAMLCVMLIACANVANLLLARGQQRERELAVRQAVGASRLRIVRQLVIESSLMAAGSGALALALAAFLIRSMASSLAAMLPRFWLPDLGREALAYHLGLTALGAVLFSLVPLWQCRRLAATSLKVGSPTGAAGGRLRTASTLVVLELTLAAIFLAGAGIMVESFQAIQWVDPGFDTANLVVLEARADLDRRPAASGRTAAWTELEARLAALPGVEGVTVSNLPPRTGAPAREAYRVDGAPPSDGAPPTAIWVTANPSYFSTLGIPLERGRAFTATDHQDTEPVAIVNRTLARSVGNGGDALGKSLTLLGRSRRIVGVASDVRHDLWAAGSLVPTVYVPWRQEALTRASLTLRAPIVDDPAAAADLFAAIRREVRALGGLEVHSLVRFEQLQAGYWAGQRIFSTILTGLGLLALALSALGIYGLLAYSVSRRTREIGVRMALGASRARIVRQVTFQGLRLALLGLGLGLLGMVWVENLLAAVLAGLTAVPLQGALLVVLALLGVALLASAVPALRASRVDPTSALRYD